VLGLRGPLSPGSGAAEGFERRTPAFMRHDITWPLYVEVDRIYNLACLASPVQYQFDPLHL
jgi:hypothetical protein